MSDHDNEQAEQFAREYADARENPENQRVLLQYAWALRDAYRAGLAAGRAEQPAPTEEEDAAALERHLDTLRRGRYWQDVLHAAAALWPGVVGQAEGYDGYVDLTEQAVQKARALVEEVYRLEAEEEAVLGKEACDGS